MNILIYPFSTLAVAGAAALTAQAADPGGYDEGSVNRGPVVGASPVVRPYYQTAPSLHGPRYCRTYPHWAGYYPYRYGYWERPYQRGHSWAAEANGALADGMDREAIAAGAEILVLNSNRPAEPIFPRVDQRLARFLLRRNALRLGRYAEKS